MKILLYTINYKELTGPGKFTYEMATWLAARGHEISVVTAPPYYPAWKIADGYSSRFYKRELIDGVRVWRCPLWVPKKPTGKTRLLHLASFVLSSIPVLAAEGFSRPDVVLVTEPAFFCTPWAWALARITGAPAWLHIWDFEIEAAVNLDLLASGVTTKWALAAESWMTRKFDIVSTLTPMMLERLKAKGIDSSKTVCFPTWVDTDLIHPVSDNRPIKESFGIPADVAVALYSGNMGEKQGLDLIIDVARRLEGNRSIRFVMCGEGAAGASLRKAARGLSNMAWLPVQPLERLNELLNLADVHLLPQRAGAADLVMPSKLTGIFASGRPVIATARPGTQLHEVVGGRGVVVAPDDIDAFSAALLNLSHDSRRREMLGNAARQYALAHWDRDLVLGRFEAQMLQVATAGTERSTENHDVEVE